MDDDGLNLQKQTRNGSRSRNRAPRRKKQVRGVPCYLSDRRPSCLISPAVTRLLKGLICHIDEAIKRPVKSSWSTGANMRGSTGSSRPERAEV
ncbi:hypothetical protein VTN02DRAFT_4944 [Thermoascus thermophilus]